LSILDSILLGILQGITEFLPVSSDGHLVVVQQMLGFEHSLLAYDVFIHIGTLLAVIAYYHRELIQLVVGVFGGANAAPNRRLLSLLVVASLPTAIIGLALKSLVHDLNTSALAAALGWLVTGVILLMASRTQIATNSAREISYQDALLMGIAQGIAVLPGVSRSGSTVATGLFRGIQAPAAANFSFLMSIPAVAGALLLQIDDLHGLTQHDWSVYITGGIAAALTGFVAIWGLLKLLNRRIIAPFGWYCLLAGVVTIAVLLWS
jgi:undecaprenyl-diphosphatase